MKVGIMGAGSVGQSLGKALISAGHQIMFSSRTPNSPKMRALVTELGDAAQTGTLQETLAFSPVVALALSGGVVAEAVRAAGDWTGKILLDMTQISSTDIAQWSGARVVKIFNSIGANNYQNPDFRGQAATMFYCGDDDEAKQVAGQLAAELGFEPIDIGDLSQNTHLVNLAMLWIHLSRSGHGRNIAFKLLRR